MGTCSAVGQAAGTAAALCARDGVLPRQLYDDKKRLFALRQALLRDDQSIKNARNEDPRIWPARPASPLRPSATTPAALVLNGWVRDIPKKSINQWMARMGPEGAWIELAWDRPRRIREVQLTFDTGFQRELTLSS